MRGRRIKGKIDEVTDEEILAAYRKLLQQKGYLLSRVRVHLLRVFTNQFKMAQFSKGSKVVAVLTGNGLKDPTTAIDSEYNQTSQVT